MTRAVSISGMVVVAAVCALSVGCAFDPHGTRASGGDDDDDGREADASAPPPPPPGTIDAGPAEVPDAAAPPVDGPGTLHCRRVTEPPLLDGQIDDWPLEGLSGFDMDSAAQIVDESLLYQASMAVEFRCAHDAQNLYFAVHVLDDQRVVDSTKLYDDDAAHIYLDARGDAAGAFAGDDHEIVVRADGQWHDYAEPPAPVGLTGSVLADRASEGFTIEIAIAKASLGASPLPARLGFDLALTDDDGLGSFAYGLWFLSERASCPGCCSSFAGTRAWCDTTTFGGLALD
jgi:hypothetical protein